MRTSCLVLAITALIPAATVVRGHDIHIESHEIPLEIDTWGRYRQNNSIFMWTPFDSTRQVWDLTIYPGGRFTRSGLRDYTEGRDPAPDSMEEDDPDPDVCSFDTLGTGSIQWTYLYLDEFGLYLDGIDFSQGGFRFLGNYYPDAAIYVTPMYRNAGWLSAIAWQYEIYPGIPYAAAEQHTKRIVAKGKVKVPMSGEYYWPCLVIKDYSVFTDNFGSNDRRWIYEWVVPGHFLGGNGVAAAMSQNGASEDFINVEALFQMNNADIPDWDLIPPEFSNTTVWPDTDFAGPYLVVSTITDDDDVGAESLFYRVNQGAWTGVPSDSANGNEYWFTIPQVTMPARVDYYIWAMDDFCDFEEIDFWTTWPVCSPESTMVTFYAALTGVESPPTPPGPPSLAVAPNPFRTRVDFSLANVPAGQGRIDIYGVTGRLVRTLTPGPGGTAWDGTDEDGIRLAAGAYLYRLTSPGFSANGKLLLRD